MRRLVHLSDLHFGRTDPGVVEALVTKVSDLSPHLVAVSGDLTQRARSHQFAEAAAFLARLPRPQIVVPGNHDLPLYNVYDRFVNPREKYSKYICTDLQPFFSDGEIAVQGIDSTRSFTIKGGRVKAAEIVSISQRLKPVSERALKIIVTHHPFDLPDGIDEDEIVRGAQDALAELAECGASVFLSGHLHVSHISDSARRYKLKDGRTVLIIQAGTAASTRGRGEANSFNLIEFEAPRLIVSRFECRDASVGFLEVGSAVYERTGLGWQRT